MKEKPAMFICHVYEIDLYIGVLFHQKPEFSRRKDINPVTSQALEAWSGSKKCVECLTGGTVDRKAVAFDSRNHQVMSWSAVKQYRPAFLRWDIFVACLYYIHPIVPYISTNVMRKEYANDCAEVVWS